MNKDTIYETAFNMIKDSTEWGVDQPSKEFGNYICGICDFAEELIEVLDEVNDEDGE